MNIFYLESSSKTSVMIMKIISTWESFVLQLKHVETPFKILAQKYRVLQLARQWQCCNDLVVSWLTNFLSKDIAHSIEYSSYARDIWVELEECYRKADRVRIFEP